MNWTELLKAEMNSAYHATEGLMKKIHDDQLAWKPATENNWMTMAQLLMHLTQSCGLCCKGFVTDDWSFAGEAATAMPTAEEMPGVESLDQAFAMLKEDRQLALAMVEQAGEDDLAGKMVTAPWAPGELNVGLHLLHMVMHLQQHRDQLFYYLKLLGRPVHTGDLWGIE